MNYNKYRNKYNLAVARTRLKTILLILIVAGIGFVIWLYRGGKLDNSLPENLRYRKLSDMSRTLDEITDISFDEISFMNTTKQKYLDPSAYINTYKGKKFKTNPDINRLVEEGNNIYYLFNKDRTFLYEVHDLGGGTIKVNTNRGESLLLDLVIE